MIQDALLTFSSAQVITATADSTNIIDLSIARDLGLGGAHELYLQVSVGAVFATLTSLNVQFLGAPDNGSGAPGAYSLYAESGVIPVANLTAGAQLLRIPVPAVPAGYVLPRFYKLTYTVAGSNATTGNVTAFITPDRQANTAYAPGVTSFL